MKDKKFSVIIPVYNVRTYLKKCMDSILGQTFQNFEVIIVDDGSNDGSEELCDEYAKAENVICFHQENQGQAKARNFAIKKATGEYLLFVDSDDYYLTSDALKRIAEKADGCDLVEFGWREIPDGKMIEEGVSGITTGKPFYAEYKTGIKYLEDALEKVRLFNWYPCIRAYRKEFWLKNGFEFPVGKKYEDVTLIPQVILKAEDVKVIDDELYGYRINREGSTTTAVNLQYEKDKILSVEENIKKITSNPKIDQRLTAKLCDNLSCLYYSALIQSSALEDRKERQELLDVMRDKVWISEYTLYNPQRAVAKMIHLVGLRPMAFLLGVRRKVKNEFKK